MIQDYFILPFKIGLVYLLIITLVRFIRWITGLSAIDKVRMWKGVFSKKTFASFKEVFFESLLHRKIFKKNPVLGYMHMSLAFGWFLMIVWGHIETIFYKQSLSFPFQMPIFFRYYVGGQEDYMFSGFFSFTMDLLLLFVLSGLGFALYKRLNKKIFGLKKTTRLKPGDRIALASLWLIFPLRLLAESITAGIYHNGSFLTQTTGNFFGTLLPLENLYHPVWLAYSISLGLFFLALPNSRYMHIPAEVLYIFLKNYGIKLKRHCNTFSFVQVYSCSRCGICLDTCQMNNAQITDTQSVYILKHIRNRNLTDEKLFNCLLCGRCQEICPVDIKLNDLRITQRIESTIAYNSSYNYLKNNIDPKADVIYYAGCMSHLTPSIKQSITEILKYAGINYLFLDEHKAACCGRPLIKAGQFEAAQKLIINNQDRILASGAKTLLVSCPICYKSFKEDYSLPGVEVKHHSQYLLELLTMGKIPAHFINNRGIYHDPCELGRGCEIYEEPRILLSNYINVLTIKDEKKDALCCGGSLANIKIQMHERDRIRDKVLANYEEYHPDFIITSCPLCKKTFTKGNKTKVFDLSEIVWKAILQHKNKELVMGSKNSQNKKELVETKS